MKYNFLVQKYKSFNIVRGDMINGGIKRIILENILKKIPENKIFSTAHTLGHSHLALALAAATTNKKVYLYYAENPNLKSEVFKKVQKLKNVTMYFYPKFKKQKDLGTLVKKEAKESNGYYMPLGLETKEFSNELKLFALSLGINPKEIWLTSGSGTTARALKEIWPNTSFNIVNMKFTEPTISSNIFNIRETPSDSALSPPPYDSSVYYDSKMWYFINKYASKNAYIWNMAGSE